MSEALTPPESVAVNPAGIDQVIDEIQFDLTGLPWLKKSLGRVKPQLVDGKLEPWIQINAANKEYYRAYPNDTLDSFSCLYPHDDEQQVNYQFNTRTLSVIVWVNLESLVRFGLSLEHLKQQIRSQLGELYCVMEIGQTRDQTATGLNGIYPGFDMSGFETRYLTFPYAAFRIECVTQWADLCNKYDLTAVD